VCSLKKRDNSCLSEVLVGTDGRQFRYLPVSKGLTWNSVSIYERTLPYLISLFCILLSSDLLRSSGGDGEVMKWSMGILLNGLTDCRPNIALFKKLNGMSILESINWGETPAPERENLKKWADEIRGVLSRWLLWLVYMYKKKKKV